MLSDNGKTFRGAAKIIRNVKWSFNVPKAPWWGKVFERLIKSTKRCLKKIIGQARLLHDELLTALTEVEMVLNSRPLSYVAADNLEEPLTPSHLLPGRRLMTNPDCLTGGQVDDEETFEIEPDGLNMRVKHLNHTLDQFWCRWRREYLTNLREAHKIRSKNSSAPRVSVGDVVTIHEDGQPRGMWKLGVVENLLVGRDQEVRAAVLRVPGRGRNIQHLSRPVQKLYPLEMPKEKESHTDKSVPAENSSNDSCVNQDQESELQDQRSPLPNLPSPPPSRRPRRAAADQAKDRMLAQFLNDVDD